MCHHICAEFTIIFPFWASPNLVNPTVSNNGQREIHRNALSWKVRKGCAKTQRKWEESPIWGTIQYTIQSYSVYKKLWNCNVTWEIKSIEVNDKMTWISELSGKDIKATIIKFLDKWLWTFSKQVLKTENISRGIRKNQIEVLELKYIITEIKVVTECA